MSRLFIALLLGASLAIPAATPVEANGALKVSGSKVVGSHGRPVQVAGPSLYWSVWGGQNYYNRATVDWVVKDWKATLIRAAMAVDINQTYDKGYLANPTAQVQLVKTVVDAAIANGIYVIIDWHDHDANLHATQAKVFFEEMGKLYGSSPNVIWEIWNEPDGKNGTGDNGKDSWADIRGYAAQVIPVIRKYSSNLIVVGTPNWSQDVDIATEEPIDDPNLAYTLHFYAGTHKSSLRSKGVLAMSRGKALFITEWGTTTADGGQHPSASNGNVDNFKVYPTETATWLDWADKNGISWANWSLSNKDEASAALLKSTTGTTGGWASTQLSESGNLIRNRLLRMDSIARAAALPTTPRTVAAPLEIRQTPGRLSLTTPTDVRSVVLRDPRGQVLFAVTPTAGHAEMSMPRGVALLEVIGGTGTRTIRLVGM